MINDTLLVSAADKGANMNEKDAPEGGYMAKALGESIYTDADNLEELHANVQDAVRCHFDEDKKPKMIRLRVKTKNGNVTDQFDLFGKLRRID